MVCDGKVLAAFRTKEDPESPGKLLAVWPVQRSDFRWYSDDDTAMERKEDAAFNTVVY
jgi:hypothetical protein